MRFNVKLWQSRFAIVATGIVLGFLARYVIGPPVVDNPLPTREFKEPLPDDVPLDLPLTMFDSGVVEPIDFDQPEFRAQIAGSNHETEYLATDSAHFEPHGEQVCASGCALSRHPTNQLTEDEFSRLVDEYRKGPMSSDNSALESLLYYGPQSIKFLESIDRRNVLFHDKALNPHLAFLKQQLKLTHAKISIRVIDDEESVRTWLEPTIVPLDRRHVFEMQTDELQPLVTSGTVKRVGLNHLWTRL